MVIRLDLSDLQSTPHSDDLCTLADAQQGLLDGLPPRDMIVADFALYATGQVNDSDLPAFAVEIVFGGGAISCMKLLASAILQGGSAYTSIQRLVYHPAFPYQFFFFGGSTKQLSQLCEVDEHEVQRIPSSFLKGLSDRNLYDYLSPGTFVGVFWQEECPLTGRPCLMETVGLVALREYWVDQGTPSILIIPEAFNRDCGHSLYGIRVLRVHSKQTFVHRFGPTVMQFLAFQAAIDIDPIGVEEIAPDASRYDRGNRFKHDSLVKIIAGEYYGQIAQFDGDATAGHAQHEVVVKFYTHANTRLSPIVLPASYITTELSPFDRVIYEHMGLCSRAYVKTCAPFAGSYVEIVLEETGDILNVPPSSLQFARTTAVCAL